MKTPIEAYPEDIRHIPQDPYPPMEVDFNAHKREGYEKAVEEMKNELVEWLGGQIGNLTNINFNGDNYDAGKAHAWCEVIKKLKTLKGMYE